jgi:uncharacterized membrane protein YhhN
LTLNRSVAGLTVLSGAAAILAFVGLLPAPLAFVFKPLTTLLVIAFAWPRGAEAPKQRRFIRIGLVLSLAGDVFLLWPERGFVPGLVAFLLAHLASDSLLATTKFAIPLPLSSLWILATYRAAQWCIASALRSR